VSGLVAEMPELVRIAHDIDADDLVVLDLEPSRLHAVVLDGDETRQAVDEAVTQLRDVLSAKTRAIAARNCMTSSRPMRGRFAAGLFPPPSE
jgi:hypothetical protein